MTVHGKGSVAKLALIGAVLPIIVETPANWGIRTRLLTAV